MPLIAPPLPRSALQHGGQQRYISVHAGQGGSRASQTHSHLIGVMHRVESSSHQLLPMQINPPLRRGTLPSFIASTLTNNQRFPSALPPSLWLLKGPSCVLHPESSSPPPLPSLPRCHGDAVMERHQDGEGETYQPAPTLALAFRILMFKSPEIIWE